MYRMLFLAMSLIVMGAIPSLTLAEPLHRKLSSSFQ